MKNKKKPMVNSSSTIRHLSTTLKMGSWSTKEDTILLSCPSNIMAGIILQRPHKACGSHRYLLVKDGRKSVPMKRMKQEKASELAYKYLAQIKKESEETANNINNINVMDQKANTSITKEVEIVPISVEEVGGLVIILNDQEMVMKTSPKKLVIKGEKLNITIE